MSASPFPPQTVALARLLATDEDACLAFRSALVLMRGEAVPHDDQKRIRRYVAHELGEDWKGDQTWTNNAGRSPSIVGELVVILLKYGAFPATTLLALHLSGRKRGLPTVPETKRFLRVEALSDDAPATIAFARELAVDDVLCGDFWASVAATRGEGGQAAADNHVPPSDQVHPEIARACP